MVKESKAERSLRENGYTLHNDAKAMGLRGSFFPPKQCVLFGWVRCSDNNTGEDLWVKTGQSGDIMMTTTVPELIDVDWIPLSDLVIRDQRREFI